MAFIKHCLIDPLTATNSYTSRFSSNSSACFVVKKITTVALEAAYFFETVGQKRSKTQYRVIAVIECAVCKADQFMEIVVKGPNANARCGRAAIAKQRDVASNCNILKV